MGSGLPITELHELTALLESLEQPVSPFTGAAPALGVRQIRRVLDWGWLRA
jgi:hypothetical protein